MMTIQKVSARVYAALLPLYPPDLLRDFGPEMAEAFAEDLADALQHRGLAGGIRVWWRSLCELVRIALPRQAENPAFAVPCILFALSETLISAELMLAIGQKSGASAISDMHLVAIPVITLWPSTLAALTALAAVRAGNRGLPAQLRLSSI